MASRPFSIDGLNKYGDLTETIWVRTLVNFAFAHKVESVRRKYVRALIFELARYTNQPRIGGNKRFSLEMELLCRLVTAMFSVSGRGSQAVQMIWES